MSDAANVARISALPCWDGIAAVEPLAGGITNRNYLARDASRQYVVRVCDDRSFLGIDRRNELVCQQAAAVANVSPAVVYSESGILVSEFIECRTLTDADVRTSEYLPRIAGILRTLHGARSQLVGEMLFFCPFQTVRTYTSTARRLNAALPSDINELVDDANDLQNKLRPFQPTLCHNDLLAANILDDGERLHLVDWEYAGIGNPLFDLASVSANSRLTSEHEANLVAGYGLQPDATTLQELRVLKTVSLLREGLWAVIQTVKSNIDFDYVQYGNDNFAAYREARRSLAISD